MSNKYTKDLLEVMTAQDGQFNDEINAYVTSYAYEGNRVSYELEYVDTDTEDFEIIETVRFTVTIEDGE